MLINFTLQNWMSFRDETQFTMTASKEQQHGDRLAKLNKYRLRTLPTAAIYGGNASGKTNFFKAMYFAKKYISNGMQPNLSVPVQPFLLDSSYKEKPSSFCFEMLIDNDIYEYSFALTAARVLEEKLVRITSTSEKVLYHRVDGDDDPHLAPSLPEKMRLKYVFEGTRENQLFLTNSVSQRVDTFLPVYKWFAKDLVLVGPDSRFEPFELFIADTNPLYKDMNRILPDLDTGICHIGGEKVILEELPFSAAVKQQIVNSIREDHAIKLEDPQGKFIFTKENGEIVAKKLYTYHKNSSGGETRFEMFLESDGSKRIIDILPAFLELASEKSTQVYVIDEIDRSLHYLLLRQLMESYLSGCGTETRKQLLFTTHDLLLMDQNLFRRDEMWITERKQDGSSNLLSFSEYVDVRNDKDILKSYLQGRMGGVPSIVAEPFNKYRDK